VMVQITLVSFGPTVTTPAANPEWFTQDHADAV